MFLIPLISDGAFDASTIPNAIELDGSNDDLSRVLIAGDANNWTIAAWVRFWTLGKVQTVWSANNGTTTGNDKIGLNASNNLTWTFAGSTGTTTEVLGDSTGWYHIHATCNAGSFTLSVNGSSVATAAGVSLNQGATAGNTMVWGSGRNSDYASILLAQAGFSSVSHSASSFVTSRPRKHPAISPLISGANSSLLTFDDENNLGAA